MGSDQGKQLFLWNKLRISGHFSALEGSFGGRNETNSKDAYRRYINMIRLYSPENQIELAILSSLLEGEGIFHFVHNDFFGTLRVGPRIDLLNKKTILVPASRFDDAREVFSEYLRRKEDASTSIRLYSRSDRIRMIIECLAFGWFVPGNRWPMKGRKGNATDGVQ
jgi:hypothetical protein